MYTNGIPCIYQLTSRDDGGKQREMDQEGHADMEFTALEKIEKEKNVSTREREGGGE